MREATIERADFQAAIDAGLLAAREEMEFDAYVTIRSYGHTLTEAGAGSFTLDCPIAIYERAGHHKRFTAGWQTFAVAFDKAISKTLDQPMFRGKLVIV